MSIIPLRSDAIKTIYIRDKNAKHKNYDDEKSRRRKYVRTRNSMRIKERANGQTHAQPYGCGKIGQKQKASNWKERRKNTFTRRTSSFPYL